MAKILIINTVCQYIINALSSLVLKGRIKLFLFLLKTLGNI